jgi:hypothetical protein
MLALPKKLQKGYFKEWFQSVVVLEQQLHF